ncbi:hypothetical protein JF50_11360 [Pseudoalteromonas luteoviolacea]|uniref:Uncharacterized protein n=1 Tax=Pseudoalteromonas luteoviolacea TaxID=43657 RepID=A0A0C1QAS8_9GAMM|nr:hypothetical protein JF50_11360 [Pseudoalteromonas luteoviolacea]
MFIGLIILFGVTVGFFPTKSIHNKQFKSGQNSVGWFRSAPHYSQLNFAFLLRRYIFNQHWMFTL